MTTDTQTETRAITATQAAPTPVVQQAQAHQQSYGLNPWLDTDSFVQGMRMAQALAKSAFVPVQYQFEKQGEGAISNCLIALNFARLTRSDPLMVMQNLDVIYGRPSLRSQFIIACVNSTGRFSPLEYEWRGKEADGTETITDEPHGPQEHWACRVVAVERSTGKTRKGTWISWTMVLKEGWTKKDGSKWLSMPEQMFRYRSAAFWGRSYTPELLMGMQSREEAIDVPFDEYDVVDGVDERPRKRDTREPTVRETKRPTESLVPTDLYADAEVVAKPAPAAAKAATTPTTPADDNDPFTTT